MKDVPMIDDGAACDREQKQYKTLYADPPWMERGGGKTKRGADRHYPLMKTAEIMALAPMVGELIGENAHLYLWATNTFLPDAFQVIDAWGFDYKTCITWMKDRIGLGQYFRGKSEHCLFAVKGMIPYRMDETTGKRQQGVTAFQAARHAHSEKPQAMRDMIELVSPGPYIELFTRQTALGWDSRGMGADKPLTFDRVND